MELQRGFTRRFNYPNSLEDDLYLRTVFDNDVENFKALVDADRKKHGQNTMLLYFVIKHKRWEMFDHVLNFDTFVPDCVDNLERTLLMSLASMSSSEDYARALIDKGADVRWTDRAGFTFLHMAAREADVDNTKIAQMVIERGADINAQNDYGETPLFIACYEGNSSLAYFLLYHGADPGIANENDLLPIASTGRWISQERQELIHDLLFDYTFDDKIVLELPILTAALQMDTPLFPRIVEKLSDVVYNKNDLQDFCGDMKYMKLKHLKLFLEKFGEIVSDLIDNCSLLITLLEHGWISDSSESKQILDLFLESEYGPDLVQSCERGFSVINTLVEVFNQDHCFVDKEEITKTSCLMLTYGLNLTSVDLDTVFRFYGHCDLFRILLYMDNPIRVKNESTDLSIASLYYDLSCNIEDFSRDSSIAVNVLHYYNHSKLKEICLAAENEEIAAIARRLPEVPSLVELSRNAARQHIINSYQIETARRFYTILKRLPIGEINQKILALERKLYWT